MLFFLTRHKLLAAPVRLRKSLLCPAGEASNHQHLGPGFLPTPAGILSLVYAAHPRDKKAVTPLAKRSLDRYREPRLCFQ